MMSGLGFQVPENVSIKDISGQGYECIASAHCPKEAVKQFEIENKVYCVCEDHCDPDFVVDMFFGEMEADLYHRKEMWCHLD